MKFYGLLSSMIFLFFTVEDVGSDSLLISITFSPVKILTDLMFAKHMTNGIKIKVLSHCDVHKSN